MALFEGEELVDITTPDGRTLKLPRSAIPSSMMPQAAQAPAGPAPFAPPASPQQEAAAPTLPPPDAPQPGGVVEMGDPEVTPVVQMEPEIVSANPKRVAKARATQAAAAASPTAKMAGAEQQTQNALGSEKTAIVDAANVDAAAQDVLAQAAQSHNERIDGFINDKARVAQERFEAEEQKFNQIGTLRKKIANTKIDRKADHPILAAISIALAGLGSAMQNRGTGQAPSNTALELFWKSLDRKVADQMADLDLMEKTYGMQKDELGDYKAMTGRKLEVYNGMIAGEADKAKRHLEEIIAKSASEKTRANAKILMAQIDQRAAGAHQDAVRWGLDYDQKERAEKNQQGRFYSQLKQADRHHNDNVQLKREDMYLDYQKALAAERARGSEASYKAKLEMIKDNETRGIRNTVTGDALLTPRGRAMMAEAEKLEAEAAKIEASKGPMGQLTDGASARANALRERAQIVRGDAQITEMVRHRDPTQAGRLADQYSTVQNMTTLVDEIKLMYDKPGEGGKSYIYTTEGQQVIQAKTVEVLMSLKNAWALGVLSKQDATLIEKAMGGNNPIDGWTAGNLAEKVGLQMGKDPNAFKAVLDSVVAGSQNEVYLKTRGSNFGGTKEELFYRQRPPETTPEGKAVTSMSKDKTPGERAKAAEASGEGVKGAVATGVQKVFYGTSPAEQAAQAGESGSVKHLGLLSPQQGKDFDTLLNSYKAGNKRSGDLLVSTVLNNATARPELANAMLKNLKEHAGDLYAKASAGIKGGPLAERLEYEEKNRIGAAQIPTPQLLISARVGDEESKKELARRATSGDKDAVRAVRELVLTRQRDDLPSKSVFREGR
jgi:hypothetical protein